MGLQRDQRIEGEIVERRLRPAGGQNPREGRIAEILQQQETPVLVGGVDQGRGQAECAQVAGLSI